MEVQDTAIDDVKVLIPIRHRDARGFLSEVYNWGAISRLGSSSHFVQENHTFSHKAGTVRGLHFQIEPAEAAKIVRVVRGSIFDVAVDLRTGSPTFGQHISHVLSAENWHQLFIPEGFAHGFCTMEDNSEVSYMSTAHWEARYDRGLLWNDPDLGIDWPVDPDQAVVSEKDRGQPLLRDLQTYFAYRM